jgi:hypothetical protein
MTNRNALIPDPFVSEQSYIRFHHSDICGLEDIELTDELYYLRPLLWGLDANHWLRERVTKLEEEIQKRTYSQRRGS